MTAPAQKLGELFGTCRMVLSLQCGDGELLAVLADLGVPAVGLDSEPSRVEVCRARSLVAWPGSWTILSAHPEKFDGVHAPLDGISAMAPAALFAALATTLLPGGLLVLTGIDRALAWQSELPPTLELRSTTRSMALLLRVGVPHPLDPAPPIVLGAYADLFVDCQKVLEVGSGRGHFLDALHVRGIRGDGLESDPELAAAGRARGLRLECGGAELLCDRPGSCDGLYLGAAAQALPAAEIDRLLALAAGALVAAGRLVWRCAKPDAVDDLRDRCAAVGMTAMMVEVPGEVRDVALVATRTAAPAPVVLDGSPLPIAAMAAAVNRPFTSLHDLDRFERRVCSQGGEDGVLDAIFAHVGVTDRYYVELGCGDGLECNTAHLRRQGWRGVLMDGMARPAADDAEIHAEWITPDNVSGLLAKYGAPQEFDLLSIDLDGNDFWVWQALRCRPRVVVVEYNANLGPRRRLVMPGDPEHRWDGTDFYGAALAALARLGDAKGYRLVYCNQAGVNAFFVRHDLAPGLPERAVEHIYRPPNYWYRGARQMPNLARVMVEV